MSNGLQRNRWAERMGLMGSCLNHPEAKNLLDHKNCDVEQKFNNGIFLGMIKYNRTEKTEEFTPASKMTPEELDKIRIEHPGIVIHFGD